MAARKGLGRGLDSMIPDRMGSPSKEAASKSTNNADGTMLVNINKIEPNRNQPRKAFDEESLKELADSIKQYGIIQPLLVSDKKDYYEIIAGERRWRAAKMAGIKEIPVIVKKLTDQEIMEISLIENIQREDLNPIEEAAAYKRLLEEFHLTQEEAAERVGKSRSAVTNALRLLKLDERVQEMLADGIISMGHARALLAIEDGNRQYEIAQKIQQDNLSVRDVEKLVREKTKKQKTEPADRISAEMKAIYKDLEEQLKGTLGTKVSINYRDAQKGRLEIDYYSQEDLDHIINLLRNN